MAFVIFSLKVLDNGAQAVFDFDSQRNALDRAADNLLSQLRSPVNYFQDNLIEDSSINFSSEHDFSRTTCDDTPFFDNEHSVNIDGSPMCGSVDIHGNAYGITSD